MKLAQVEIFDFKSIKHELIDIDSSQLCFVGKNECGKSSIIQAISYLDLLGSDLSDRLINKDSASYPSGYPVISGVFELDRDSYPILLKLVRDQLDTETIKEIPPQGEKGLLQVKRWGNGISNFSIFFTDGETFKIDILESSKQKARFVDEFTSKLYPAVEYYEDEELLIEPATVQDLVGSEKRFETFRRLLQLGGCADLNTLDHDNDNFISTLHARIEDRLNAILKKHYRQDDSIRVSIRTIRGNRLNLVIKDSSGQSFAIDERSPGFRYYFSFLINKLWSKQNNGNRRSIILLDEPGQNLHPSGAKDLLQSFNEVAETNQILYTTHNPFLTIRNDAKSLVFVSKSPSSGTKAHRKPYLNKYQVLRNELGILLNDSFLIGDINLIVEGSTEKLAFHRLFQREAYRDLEWLNIFDAGGVTNVSQALNYLGPNNLDLAGIAFLDSDKEAGEEKKKKQFKNVIDQKKWDFLEVNDGFDDNVPRTFEDLFPQDMYVNSFNEYCQMLNKIGVFDSEYSDFELGGAVNPPIIEQLSAHFLSFFSEENRKANSLSKQTIISILLDQIEKLNASEQDAALAKVYKVLDKLKTKFKRVEKYAGQ